MNSPRLSILCITYNQAKYIRRTLDCFVMQKTNFPFVAYVGDDCSTDGTTEIVREYAEKYPNIIKPVYHKVNTWTNPGSGNNFMDIARLAETEYVAVCEGDDYWTDENKLQKQVDFLDANPDCSVCFHPVDVIWEDKSQPDSVFPKPSYRFNKTKLTLDDLLKHNFIQTNSVVYRWRFRGGEKIDGTYPTDILPGDYYLHLLHAEKGAVGFISDVMAVYSRNAGGIWTGAGKTDEWFIKYAIPHIKFYNALEKRFGKDFSKPLAKTWRGYVAAMVRARRAKEIDNSSVPAGYWAAAEKRERKHKKLVNKLVLLAAVEFFAIAALLILK